MTVLVAFPHLKLKEEKGLRADALGQVGFYKIFGVGDVAITFT